MARIDIDWLRTTRVMTQYVAPALVAVAFVLEAATFAGLPTGGAYQYLVAITFSLLTLMMIGMCGWIVFLWDIDRLFFSLERRIDAEAKADAGEPDGSLLGPVCETIATKGEASASRGGRGDRENLLGGHQCGRRAGISATRHRASHRAHR